MAGDMISSYPQYRFTYSGRALLVTDLAGLARTRALEGFYLDNTRALSRDELKVAGAELTPIAAAPTAPGELLAYFRMKCDEGEGLPTAVNLELRRLVGEGMLSELVLEYAAPSGRVALDLHWHLGADFADVTEAVEGRRRQDAPVATEWQGEARELTFRYEHAGLDRATVVQVEQSPVTPVWKDGFLVFALDLDARRPIAIRLAVVPVFDAQSRPPTAQRFGDDRNPVAALCRRLKGEAPVVSTTNAGVADAWEAAVADLASLPLGLASAPVAAAAGIPTYQQFFGRDALTIGIQSAMAFPAMLRDALLATAETQGRVIDDWRDEEPGKILHQANSGPLAALGITPFARYYGDYSAPQDFLLGLACYLLWTGDRQLAHRLLPTVSAVIAWADRYGDSDGDGFLEYDTRSPKGLKNQGWKDSGDAIVDSDGRIVDDPIAACEVQTYWYTAQRAAALIFVLTGHLGDAVRCLGQARRLRARFDRAFWMEDEGFYAMALAPDKRPVRSIASNAGHALAAGIAAPDRGRRVARRLMAPDLFSGWGVRTLSADHVAYDPFSYHRGSVWPVDTGTSPSDCRPTGVSTSSTASPRVCSPRPASSRATASPKRSAGFRGTSTTPTRASTPTPTSPTAGRPAP